jgi:hypothetical protein
MRASNPTSRWYFATKQPVKFLKLLVPQLVQELSSNWVPEPVQQPTSSLSSKRHLKTYG